MDMNINLKTDVTRHLTEFRRESANKERVIGLDLLRISLALLIFMFHSSIHVLKCEYGLLTSFVRMGGVAMTGFFLLSGYTINLSSSKKDMADVKEIKQFYIKRLIAILPLYYTWALIFAGTNIVVKGIPGAIEEMVLFPIETLGIQSVFATLFPFSHNGGSWFISCILICYFAFPLLQLLTKDLSNRGRMLLIIILGAVLLYSPLIQRGFHLQSIYSNPFFRVLEFTIGILVCQINTNPETESRLVRFMRKPIISVLTIIILIVGISVAYGMGIPADFMLYSWIALPCFISLLISLGYLKFERLQGSKTIRYMSALSFSIFLSQIIAVWHVVRFAMKYMECDSNLVKICVSAAICFCIANFFHFCIEKPSARYLKVKLLK